MYPQRTASDFSLRVESAKDGLYLMMQGRLDRENAEVSLQALMDQIDVHRVQAVHADLSGVTYLDGAGISVLVAAERQAKAKGATFSIQNASLQISGFLGLVDRENLEDCPVCGRRRSAGLIERLGGSTIRIVRDVLFQITFVGELAFALLHSMRHPGKVRWGDTVGNMERVGVDALPIVGLISLLVGLVMGFQGAVSLQTYGVGILLSKLISLVMVQEMGPLITAIIVAGRSGSAFASEIGTMKVSEELDALTTMGLAPTRFVAVPKLLAMIVVMPFLTLFSDIVGVIGGMIVGVAMLNVSYAGYMNETLSSLDLWYLIHGGIKSMIFAVLIAGSGCLRGFQTEGGAEGVGRQTTSAVVTGIFLVVLANALYRIGLQAWN
ncbi:MAG: MlaE family lipid ABC transporter permease subunit [Deltaproteobacteria bacterium]|nr:MlaE family lipid ABC transporter permease subunit [Deltaproteobacteria bacterium]